MSERNLHCMLRHSQWWGWTATPTSQSISFIDPPRRIILLSVLHSFITLPVPELIVKQSSNAYWHSNHATACARIQAGPVSPLVYISAECEDGHGPLVHQQPQPAKSNPPPPKHHSLYFSSMHVVAKRAVAVSLPLGSTHRYRSSLAGKRVLEEGSSV